MIPKTKGRSACVKTADVGWNHLKSLRLRPPPFTFKITATKKPQLTRLIWAIIQRRSTQTAYLSSLLTFTSILKSSGFLLLNMLSLLEDQRAHYMLVVTPTSMGFIMFHSQVSIFCLKFKIFQGVNSVSMKQLSGPSMIPYHYISVRTTTRHEAVCLFRKFIWIYSRI